MLKGKLSAPVDKIAWCFVSFVANESGHAVNFLKAEDSWGARFGMRLPEAVIRSQATQVKGHD